MASARRRVATSFASASVVTDGERLFANFGSRGLFALSLDGAILWEATDAFISRDRAGAVACVDVTVVVSHQAADIFISRDHAGAIAVGYGPAFEICG